jgi:hypothetical protein
LGETIVLLEQLRAVLVAVRIAIRGNGSWQFYENCKSNEKLFFYLHKAITVYIVGNPELLFSL